MRGSHSTRFRLAHGRPSHVTERGFPSKQRVEWVGSTSELITDTLITDYFAEGRENLGTSS
jgi:hypothetical protein